MIDRFTKNDLVQLVKKPNDPCVTIYLARYKGEPIASILTAAHKMKLVYKYGCSD